MLVATWLTGIGLEYAVPSFEAAGIVTPAALAELSIAHFEALGISQAEDRRKLFYLVQRIKQKVEQKDESLSAVDSFFAQTQQQQQEQRVNRSNHQSVNETEEASSEQEKTSLLVRSNSTASRKNCKENRNTNFTQSKSQGSVHTDHTNGHGISSTQQRQTRKQGNVGLGAFLQKKDALEGPVNDDKDDDGLEGESGDSADDEASAVPGKKSITSVSRRQSRRLLEKKNRLSLDSNASVGSTTSTSSRKRISSLAKPVARWSTSSTSSLRKALPQGLSAAVDEEDGGLESSTSHSETPASKTRKSTGGGSGLPVSNRRPDVRAPKSMRTGKLLSTIPSNSIAPMSPLVELVPPDPTPKEKNQRNRHHHHHHYHRARTQVQPRRTNSMDLDEEDDEDDGEATDTSSRIPSPTRPREGSSDSEAQRRKRRDSLSHLQIKATNQRQQTRRGSTGKSAGLTCSHGSLPTCTTQSLTPHSPKRHLSSSELPSHSPCDSKRQPLTQRSHSDITAVRSSTGTFTIQGRKEDDSFKAQIAQLREENNADHELFVIPRWDPDEEMRIRVVVRKRPMSRNEIVSAGDVDVIHPLDYGTHGRVLVYQPRTRVDLTKEIETIPFAFDNVFDESANNVNLYERTVRNLIPSLFEGQWASIFAYGQTGSGKTFTMMGSNFTTANHDTTAATLDRSNLGLYYMAALDIFHAIQQPEYQDFTVSVSLFEIYGGKLYDLLNQRNTVKCLEDSKGKICFPGLSEHVVPNPNHLIELVSANVNLC